MSFQLIKSLTQPKIKSVWAHFTNTVVEKYFFVNTGYHFCHDPRLQILRFLRSDNVKHVNVFDVEITKATDWMID